MSNDCLSAIRDPTSVIKKEPASAFLIYLLRPNFSLNDEKALRCLVYQ